MTSALSRSAAGYLGEHGFGVGPWGIRRTQHAGQYAPRLCAAWAAVRQALATGASPRRLQAQLEKIEQEARGFERELAAKAGRGGHQSQLGRNPSVSREQSQLAQ